jgi:hypothetical protein
MDILSENCKTEGCIDLHLLTGMISVGSLYPRDSV